MWVEISQGNERDWSTGVRIGEECGNHNFLWLPLMLSHSDCIGGGQEGQDVLLH